MTALQPGDRVRCVDARNASGRLSQLGIYDVTEVIDCWGGLRLAQTEEWIWLPARFTRIGNPTIPEATLIARLKGQTPSRARNPHGALGFGDEPPPIQAAGDPLFLDGLRHAAEEDEAAGHLLQAHYIRAAADEIERLQGEMLKTGASA